MTTPPHVAREVGYPGFSQIAHAIRRSTALWAAVITSDAGTSDQAVLDRAEMFASWIRGKAADTPVPDSGFLGANPWGSD